MEWKTSRIISLLTGMIGQIEPVTLDAAVPDLAEAGAIEAVATAGTGLGGERGRCGRGCVCSTTTHE